MELYRKYRPKMFKHVVGQPAAVATLQRLLNAKKAPHALLLWGASGCGKTTIGRIVATKLKCNEHDLCEINCANDNGVEMVRNLDDKVTMRPMAGDCRIWILDEAHKLTDGAQNMLLKILEECPDHAYFIFCSTDPGRLIATVRNRCTEVKIERISDADIETIIKAVRDKEKLKVSDEVVEKIASVVDGSARKSLVLLEQVGHLDNEEEQLDAVQKADIKKQGIDIARALLDTRTDWAAMRTLLKTVTEEPEQIRWIVLGYMNSVLLNGGNRRAYEVIRSFRHNFYDSKKAGLTASCFECIALQRK